MLPWVCSGAQALQASLSAFINPCVCQLTMPSAALQQHVE